MSAAPINGARPITLATPGLAAPLAAGSRDLLASPKASVMGEEALFTMMAEMSDAQSKFGKAKVEETHARKQHALEELKAALERQREAEKGGFLGKLGLGDVAKVATIAVAVAGAVVTGGATLAIAGAVLSAGAFAVEKTKCFGDASQWVSLGMSVAGGLGTSWSVAAYGASAAKTASTAATAAETSATATAAAAGGGMASASAGASVGEATIATAEAATKTFTRIALLVEAGTHILLGAEKIENAVYAYEADHAGIDAKDARYRMAYLDRVFDEVADQLRDAKDTKQHGNEKLTAIKETQAQTLMIAAGGRV